MFLASLSFVPVGCEPLRAQEAELPPAAAAGLHAFEVAGADSAIATWLRGAIFDSPATRATLGQAFARMGERAGRMVGHDVVAVLPIGTHVRRVYAVLHYERAPAFLYLELYRAPEGWLTQIVEFNDTPAKVFPPGVLDP